MTAYTRRRLIASIWLGVAAVPFSVVLHLAQGLGFTPGAVIIGFGLGTMVGLTEFFVFNRWRPDVPFAVHLAVKSVLLVAAMFVAFATLNLLDVLIAGIGWASYARSIFSGATAVGLIEALGVVGGLLFIVQLDRLLGPGRLLGLVTGRYHRPRREQRIVMFLDLNESTALAESLGAQRYLAFLQQYFAAMSEPILATNAQIYKYVGDEVILTWTIAHGTTEAGCLRAFFLIEDAIQDRRDQFLRDFGVVPEFKAGVHAGEVVVAQIGELKTEIEYSGDVLNIAARIEAYCREAGHKLLVSSELMRQLDPRQGFLVRDLGAIPLRGRSEAVNLSAVSRNTDHVP